MQKSGNDLFIVDNSDDDWKVLNYLAEWTSISSHFDIATGYFEIGALLALDGKWQNLKQIRILMGDEVSKRTQRALLDGTAKVKSMLDTSIETEKLKNDFLAGVPQGAGSVFCRPYRPLQSELRPTLTLGAGDRQSHWTFPLFAQSVRKHPGARGGDRVRL